MGMSIILSLYQMAHKVSTATGMATNSAPKTIVSMIDHFLEYQLISDMFIQIMNPFLDLLDCLSAA